MKKITAILITFAMMFGLCACGAEETQPEIAETPVAAETPAAVPAETPAETPVQEPEAPAEITTDEIMEIYKEVLCGTREFVIGKNVKGFEEGASYKLSDFADEYRESVDVEWGGTHTCAISYAYPDCGLDGIPELAVELAMKDEENYETVMRYFVFNCQEGTPVMIGDYDYYYRSYSYINEAGVIENSGSSGAASYYAEYSYIDAAGEEHFLYSCNTEMDNSEPAISSYYLPFETAEDYYDKFFGEDVEEYYTVYVYNFSDFDAEEHESDYDEAYKEYCRSNIFCIADEHADDAAPSEAYASLYEENGVKIVSQQEAEDMVLKQFEDAGVTEEMRQAPSLEYRNLDIDQLNDEVIENEDGSITVGCAANLMDNIKDGATIYLKPGVYNLSDWANLNAGEYGYSNYARCRRYSYATDYNDHIFFAGGQVIINRINNLTIASLDPNNPAEIITDDEFNMVLSFCECSDLMIQDVVAGHSKGNEGHCSADVFEFASCDRVEVRDCDLYGCGCYGLCVTDTIGLTVNGGRIHDCTSGMAEIMDSSPVEFSGVVFENCDNEWGSMFPMYNSSADFYDCTFRNLGKMFDLTSSSAWISNSTMDDAARKSIVENEKYDQGLYMWDY